MSDLKHRLVESWRGLLANKELANREKTPIENIFMDSRNNDIMLLTTFGWRLLNEHFPYWVATLAAISIDDLEYMTYATRLPFYHEGDKIYSFDPDLGIFMALLGDFNEVKRANGRQRRR